jgi:hypothetical protein
MGDQDFRRGISEPEDWLGWWLALHPSEQFAGRSASGADVGLTAGACSGWGRRLRPFSGAS